MKVSEEFTVLLYRGDHRQLHQPGNEQAWWEGLKTEPLPSAKGLWQQTHPKSAAAVEMQQFDAGETASNVQPSDDAPRFALIPDGAGDEKNEANFCSAMSALKQIANRRNALKSTGPLHHGTNLGPMLSRDRFLRSRKLKSSGAPCCD
jgi:hypothetical protein